MGRRAASDDRPELALAALRLRMVPIRIPTVNVNRTTSVETDCWALIRAIKAAKREFIRTYLRANHQFRL